MPTDGTDSTRTAKCNFWRNNLKATRFFAAWPNGPLLSVLLDEAEGHSASLAEDAVAF